MHETNVIHPIKPLNSIISTSSFPCPFSVPALPLQFITDFELYLATVPKLAHNTIWIYMMPLRRMITIAINNRWLTYDPFSSYEIAAEETDVGYLDKDEIRAIMDVPLKKGPKLYGTCFCSVCLPDFPSGT